MDENLYRVRAERGEVQIGTWVNMVRTPSVLMLLRAAGLDFARVDMEHSPFSMETVADMAVLARAMNFPMVVRPPEGNREWITRLLDAGVWNLHVPQVDTPEQAREVAACCITRRWASGVCTASGRTPSSARARSPSTQPTPTRACT
jgi:2-keto-3-deoxy-L-rhamnonate aldolase RhmA